MKNVLFVLLALLLAWLLWKKFFSVEAMRDRIYLWFDSNGAKPEELDLLRQKLYKMTPQEVRVVNAYVFDYLAKGVPLTDHKKRVQLEAISKKYNIFT